MRDDTSPSVLDELSGTSVLVTGATGLVGGWMTAALAMAGARLSVWGRQPFQEQSPVVLLGLGDLVPRVVDITDYDAVRRAVDCAQPELVVHLAACTSVRQCQEDPRGAFLVNTVGSVNLIDALRAAGCKTRLILASTHMALRRIDPANACPLDEDEQPTSGDPYGTSKAAAELIARCYRDSGLCLAQRMALVRFANVFGYGDKQESRVISKFIRSALGTGHIPLACRSNGRQFLFVTDAVNGLLRLASKLQEKDSAAGSLPTYHFAIEQYGTQSAGFIRMRELADMIAAQARATVDAEDAVEYMPNEREVQWLACSRTRDELCWRPGVSLAQGIRAMLDWHRAEVLPQPERRRVQAGLVAEAIKQVIPGEAP